MSLQEDPAAWWAAQFAGTAYERIPKRYNDITNPNELWDRLSPILRASLESVDDANYWETACEIMNKMAGADVIPKADDPSAFVAAAYQNRAYLKPTTPELCLPYIDNFAAAPFDEFMLIQFPKAIGDPILGVRTMRYLHLEKHPAWIAFVGEHGAIGRLLDLYMPFLTTLIGRFDPKVWEFRLEMCDLMCSLVFQFIDKIDLVDDFILTLNKHIGNMIGNAPPEIAANFVRYCLRLNNVSLPRITPEAASKRLLSLIRTVPAGNVGHAAMVKLAVSHLSSPRVTLTEDAIATVIIGQEMAATYDLEILTMIALRRKSNAIARVVKFMARVMVTDPLFGRSATNLLIKIMQKSSDGEAVQWYKKFIRRLTIFVALAAVKGRYKGRVLRTAEILMAHTGTEITWMIDAVRADVAGLAGIGEACPPYFLKLFAADGTAPADWTLELEMFKSDKSIALKQFPFQTVGYKLYEAEGKKKGKKKKKGASKKVPAAETGDGVEPVRKKRVRRPKWQD